MHKKKCEFCGMLFDESNDLSFLIDNGPGRCPHCQQIYELEDILKKWFNKHENIAWENEIHKRNMLPLGSPKKIGLGITQSWQLDNHSTKYEIENRSKKIKDLINRIIYARNFIYQRLGAQIKILDSIYDSKDAFWDEGGNLRYYVNDASLQYVVIKLNELISGSNSKHSIIKILNIIENNKNDIYEKQKVFEVYKFEKSGDVLKVPYDQFPILEYKNKILSILEEYKNIIEALNDLRNNEYAHLSTVKSTESYRISYCSIKRIYNAVRIIYDGFLYSIAPDLFGNIFIDYNIWFSHLNEITENSKKYNKQRKEEIANYFKRNS